MRPDPLVDEVREVRRQISAEAGHDLKRLFRNLKTFERKLRKTGKYRFVSSPHEPATTHKP
jgi:hypothetical protein